MYTKAFEILERQRGMVYTLAEACRIGEKAQDTPAEISDDDVIVLGGFFGTKAAADAQARRAEALAPAPAAAPVTTPPPATPIPLPWWARFASPDAANAAVKDAADRLLQGASTPADLELLTLNATVLDLHGIVRFLTAMNEKNKERTAEIKTLRERINALEATQSRMEAGVKDLFDGPTRHSEIQ